ncbi:MAG TPA: alpha-amylase family glycosyl hydrolase [Candidatus Acidoferrales bacterium]|nr:alpha-amylase family glycosyl hydrolase [Candidatus Acidoferrales bacterium]
MPDRFSNGDPTNDNLPGLQPANRSDPRAYHGGDFRGIQNRLDYLKDLGITGIWMTPVYQNSSHSALPAHGYDAVDFYAVEPHFGTMRDLQQLVEASHEHGIKVMLDQVPNHCGPAHPWVEAPPTKTWFHDLDVTPHVPNNDIAALTDPYARPRRRVLPLRAWFNGRLPDLDQTDPFVRDYLIQNALWWIGETGADGFRIDTFTRVDRSFWQECNSAIKRQFPYFFTLGEASGLRTPAMMSLFQGGATHFGSDTKVDLILDFQLYRVIRSVFAQNVSMSELAEVLSQDFTYPHPEVLVPFLGNHDVPRFLSLPGSDMSRLQLAEAFLLTTRGIPHLYYGDEVGMGLGSNGDHTADRADFPGGFPGDAVDAFRPEGRRGEAALAFDFLRKVLHFRQAHLALQGGSLLQLLVEDNRYAYLRSSGNDQVLVVLDRSGASRPVEIETDDLGIPDGARFRFLEGRKNDVVVSQGKLIITAPEIINILWRVSTN